MGVNKELSMTAKMRKAGTSGGGSFELDSTAVNAANERAKSGELPGRLSGAAIQQKYASAAMEIETMDIPESTRSRALTSLELTADEAVTLAGFGGTAAEVEDAVFEIDAFVSEMKYDLSDLTRRLNDSPLVSRARR